MNTVSWFIYGSDVVGNLQPVLGFACFGAIMACGACMLAFAAEDWEEGPRYAKRILIAGVVPLALIAVLIPSKTTLYAIAASQMGEVAISSPEAREMIDDTKQILRDYLKSLKKDAAK